MNLKFSWLNSRKSLIFFFLFYFLLFYFLFFFSFNISILNNSILILLSVINSLIWIIVSYIIGRYTINFRENNNILFIHLLKILLTIVINLFFSLVLFRIFWDWNYMNFESFSNFLNDFLSFYIFLLLLSGISQSIINLYLSNKYSNNSIWLFLGTAERARYFKNIIGSNTNFKFKNINPDYLINKEINAKGIVIDDEEVLKKKNIQFLFDLNNKGMKFMKVSNWCERYLNRYPLELVKVSEMIEGNFSYKKYSFKARIKRIVESLLSLIILIPALPIMVLAGLLIKIEDGGPIFYSQIRNGFEGKQFKIIKLRTMIINAEEKGEQWADKSDKRITKSGSVLRKLRIDELPQLLLVLSGEMSLIGPRPERPKIDILLREHIPNYDLRYAVKPGISGWAQVNYPYGASIEDSKQKLSYDIYYIKNFSILLDFMIFFKTLKLIINGKGSIPQRKKKNSLY